MLSTKISKPLFKVPCKRLLLKLKVNSVRNDIINWIVKWLMDRRQRVSFKFEISFERHYSEYKQVILTIINHGNQCVEICG